MLKRLQYEVGAVATEYGLLLVLIALAVIVGAGLLGVALDAIFTDAADDLTPVVPPAGP